MKSCTNSQCDQTNPQALSCFTKQSSTKDGLAYYCRACMRARGRAYYKLIEDKSKYGDWCRANPEKAKESVRRSKAKNKNRVYSYNKQWFLNNPTKRAFYSSKRRAAKLNATPKWLSASQLSDIEAIYDNRPQGFHVDHIVPLLGVDVCGLHVSWNLQYLSALENTKKSNRTK